jgi:hypothetical protein
MWIFEGRIFLLRDKKGFDGKSGRGEKPNVCFTKLKIRLSNCRRKGGEMDGRDVSGLCEPEYYRKQIR